MKILLKLLLFSTQFCTIERGKQSGSLKLMKIIKVDSIILMFRFKGLFGWSYGSPLERTGQGTILYLHMARTWHIHFKHMVRKWNPYGTLSTQMKPIWHTWHTNETHMAHLARKWNLYGALGIQIKSIWHTWHAHGMKMTLTLPSMARIWHKN
jgi:hypothetical protein